MITTPYDFIVAQGDKASTVYLSGEVDFLASLELGPRLADITRDCSGELLFDLEGVTLIDSEGIKMLVQALESMRRRSVSARIVNCSERARRVFKLAGVDETLGVDRQRQGSKPPPQLPWLVPSADGRL